MDNLECLGCGGPILDGWLCEDCEQAVIEKENDPAVRIENWKGESC